MYAMPMRHFNQWASDALEERWLAKVDKQDYHWMWMGVVQKRGPYGYLKLKGKVLLAHRVGWELYHGSIPDGLTIDHLCLVTKCVNPDHMELVTRSENSRRQNERQRPATCPRGHTDFGLRKTGKRYCKGCNRDAYLKRNAGT